MKRLLAAAALVAALGGTASAEDSLAGTFNIKKGVLPSGKKYGGTVSITPSGGDNMMTVYTVTWNDPSGNAIATGLGYQSGKDFVVAYGPPGTAPGTIDWNGQTMDGLPAMEGSVLGDAPAIPAFVTANGKKGKYKPGDYTIMDDSNNELGTLKIAKQGKSLALTWTIGDREIHGVALTVGKRLFIAVSGGDGDFGIVDYKVKSGGAKLEGKWAMWGAAKLGTENLVMTPP
jgi:hypothetical protein